MMRSITSITIPALYCLRQLGGVTANTDRATGFLRDYGPSEAWLAKNKPTVTTPEIQVSECGTNTRLHFPAIQTFAWFEVNHKDDGYHGCPYGICRAYEVSPLPGDMKANFTNAHSFWWHETGGIPGRGVKAITNPQTGALGWEVSLTGEYKDGPPNALDEQKYHDSKYPTFKKKSQSFTHWPKNATKAFIVPNAPEHPKCGKPCEENKDPGSDKNAYGHWKPAPASAYKPPKAWVPRAEDTCFKNGTNIGNSTLPSGGGKGSSKEKSKSKNKNKDNDNGKGDNGNGKGDSGKVKGETGNGKGNSTTENPSKSKDKSKAKKGQNPPPSSNSTTTPPPKSTSSPSKSKSVKKC